MILRRIKWVCLICALCLVLHTWLDQCFANDITPSTVNHYHDLFQQEMTFIEFTPCSGSGCSEMILAIGVISENSYKKLESIILDLDYTPAIYLHSPGGSLQGGLNLGRLIRQKNLETIAGGQIGQDVFINSSFEHEVMVETSLCASACSFAFLGGSVRFIYDEQALLVHQFYSELGLSPESSTQMVVAQLHEYLDEMGIARQFIDKALTTSPANFSNYTAKDLLKMGVATSENISGLDLLSRREAMSKNSNWQLRLNGQEPQLTTTIKNPKDDLVSTVTIKKTEKGNFFFSRDFHWNTRSKKQLEYLQSYLEKLGARELSFDYNYPGDREVRPSILLDAVGGWKRVTNEHWQFSTTIPATLMTNLIATRPNTLSMDCFSGRVYEPIDPCSQLILTSKFWDFVIILDKAVQQKPAGLLKSWLKKLIGGTLKSSSQLSSYLYGQCTGIANSDNPWIGQIEP